MKTFSAAYGAVNFSRNTEPRYVFRVAFSDDSADDIWIRSHGDVVIPNAGTVLDAKLSTITVLSQKLNLSAGNSDIGKMSFSALDVNESLTNHQRSQLLDDNHGSRWRDVEFYHGDRRLSFGSYELLQTQILQSVSYKGGAYKFRCADIQRRTRTSVFEPVEMRLALPLDEESTTVELLSTLGLEAVAHDSGFTDAPNAEVAYVKIDDEIIRVPAAGIQPTQLTGVTRGVLGTRAAEHTTSEDNANEGKKVTEVIYLEGPFTRIAHAVLTGVLFGQVETLPDHWNLGIPSTYVKSSDFLSIGNDWYDSTDSTLGLPVRFIDPGKTDGKRWIEKEICRVFSCFMPVDSTGALGWRRNQPVLSGASPIFTLTDSMVTAQPEIKYDYEAIINDLTLKWNDIDGTLTRTLRLKDQESIDAWQLSAETFIAKGIHGSRYSDDQIAAILERFRDRYSNPPLRTKVTLLGSYSAFEVGDVVMLKTDHAIIYTDAQPTEAKLVHAFEIQGIRYSPQRGTVTLDLFGSSKDSGPLPASFSSTAIPDSWFTATGINGTTLLGAQVTSGSVTLSQNTTITGAADNSNSIVYFDRDVIIPQGVTISYTQNVQLRVRGVLQVLGELSGAGGGIAGATDNATLTGLPSSGPPLVIETVPATTPGTPAFLGTTQAHGGLIERAEQRTSSKYRYQGQSVVGTITQGLYGAMPGFYIHWDGSALSGVPSDLRGTSGGAGGYRYWNDENGNTTEINRGGQGGAGGAGLLIVCRGMAFGASGEVNSSGGDGAQGQYNPADEQPAFGGSGAGGAPGGTLVVIDGPSNPIPVKFGHVVADYGDSPIPANANIVEDALVTEPETRFADPELEISGANVNINRISYFQSASAGVRLGTGAFRAVLALPEIQAVEDQTDSVLSGAQVFTLAITEAFSDRVDPKVTYLKATITTVSVTNSFSHANIYAQRLTGNNPDPVPVFMGPAEPSFSFELPADGEEYEFTARAVLINGFESANAVASTNTISSEGPPLNFGAGNTVYRQSAQPANPNQNDIWFDTDNDQLAYFNGSVWQVIGNAYEFTSQLTDDAELAGAILGLNLKDSQSNIVSEIDALNKFVANNNLGGELSGNPFMTIVNPANGRPLGWSETFTNQPDDAIGYADSAKTIARLYDSAQTDTTLAMVGRAIRVDRETRIRGFIRYRLAQGSINNSGMYIRMITKEADIAQGKTAVGWTVGDADVDVGVASPYNSSRACVVLRSTDTGHANSPGSQIGNAWENRSISALNTWFEAEFEFTATASEIWASPMILNWNGLGADAQLDIDAFYLYTYGTSNKLYRQATQPADGGEGDLWHETDTDLYYQFTDGSWQLAANAYDDTGQLVDGAQLGNTANWPQVTGADRPADNATENKVFRQATAPSSGVVDGDLWYETDTKLWYQRISGAWQVAAKYSEGALADLDDIGGEDTEIVAGGSVRAGKTSFSGAQSGFWLGIDGGVAKFVFGNGAKTKEIRWDGSNLILNGGLIVGARVGLIEMPIEYSSTEATPTGTLSITSSRKVNVNSNVGGFPNGDIHQWLANDTNVGDYSVRLRKISGTDPSSGPSLNTWHVMSSTRTWSWSRSTDGSTSFDGELDLRENTSLEVLSTDVVDVTVTKFTL